MILPFLDLSRYKYVVFDEIHCLNDEEIGQDIERIFKITSQAGIPFLGLSATIGNLDWLKEKTESITEKTVETIVCERRFFNLQSGVYESGKIVTLNPLAMINADEFEDKSILNRYEPILLMSNMQSNRSKILERMHTQTKIRYLVCLAG